MSKSKLIAAKVVIGIVCAILICGVTFMGAIIGIFSSPSGPKEIITTSYDNLPNIMGDDGVYVSKNFFIENNFEIPKYVSFPEAYRSAENSVYIEDKNAIYTGRAHGLYYECVSYSNDSVELSISISCNPENINDLQNKQDYNDYTYGLIIRTSLKEESSEVYVTRYIYNVNFNRNANTSKQCQLTFVVVIEHSDSSQQEDYKDSCDKLFYSMLNNVVYRNV